MMDQMMKMKMKEKLLEELMGELDDQEAQKLKPKSVGIEMMSVKPKDEMDEDSLMHEEGGDKMSMDGSSEDDEMEDEDLKRLMMSYLGK